MTGEEQPLTPFQIEVGRLFFGLDLSVGFRLAGGSALAALGLSRRPTDDLDLFASAGSDVVAATQALVEAGADRGIRSDLVQQSATFCRLRLVRGLEAVLVDLAVDAAPLRPSVPSPIGPTFDPRELAGQKLLALFGRAAPRDFADVYVLARRFGTASLIAEAAALDRGFRTTVLAEMIAMIARYDDRSLDFAGAPAGDVRAFFASWLDELVQVPDDQEGTSRS